MDKATGTTAFMRPTNDNPTEVLLALDRELDHEVNLVLYGCRTCMNSETHSKGLYRVLERFWIGVA